VAQAFDPAGIIKTVGAPSFALFAKGGSQESLRSHAGGLRGRGESGGKLGTDGTFPMFPDRENWKLKLGTVPSVPELSQRARR
jgi:hypothetical protein